MGAHIKRDDTQNQLNGQSGQVSRHEPADEFRNAPSKCRKGICLWREDTHNVPVVTATTLLPPPSRGITTYYT